MRKFINFTILCGNAYLLYNVDIEIFHNKSYILDMCLRVWMMANPAVTGMEQPEELPPPYVLPPPYTPSPISCTVNMPRDYMSNICRVGGTRGRAYSNIHGCNRVCIHAMQIGIF